MADDKKKVPDHIKKFYDLDKKVQIMLTETNIAHDAAYAAAYDDVLKKQGKTQFDLDDVKLAEKFADKMTDTYISRIKKQLKMDDKTKVEDLDTTLLLQTYIGETKEGLRNRVREAGKTYSKDAHARKATEHVNEVLKLSLNKVVNATMKDEHAKDVVDYTGAKFLDHAKLRGEELGFILKEFNDGGGALQPDHYRKHIAYKKEKK